MDSPAPAGPVDPQEKPILDKLLHTRDSLLLLRQDKSSYIKTRDVFPYYEVVIAQVEKLKTVRKDHHNRLGHNRR